MTIAFEAFPVGKTSRGLLRPESGACMLSLLRARLYWNTVIRYVKLNYLESYIAVSDHESHIIGNVSSKCAIR